MAHKIFSLVKFPAIWVMGKYRPVLNFTRHRIFLSVGCVGCSNLIYLPSVGQIDATPLGLLYSEGSLRNALRLNQLFVVSANPIPLKENPSNSSNPNPSNPSNSDSSNPSKSMNVNRLRYNPIPILYDTEALKIVPHPVTVEILKLMKESLPNPPVDERELLTRYGWASIYTLTSLLSELDIVPIFLWASDEPPEELFRKILNDGGGESKDSGENGNG